MCRRLPRVHEAATPSEQLYRPYFVSSPRLRGHRWQTGEFPPLTEQPRWPVHEWVPQESIACTSTVFCPKPRHDSTQFSCLRARRLIAKLIVE